MLHGCSTEKNTGIHRTYHNITTRYNILFNAKELYKGAIKKAERAKNDDYTQMLPLFLYGDPALAQLITGDMEAAAKKATKAVNLHSIKVKPKVGKKGMTPAERKFYNKREFNKYMDDCYLLIGKTHLFTNHYFLALQAFSFMETEFPEEKSLYEARLWKAKTLIMDKNLVEAGRILTELVEDRDFPNKKALKSELYATIADWHIKQNSYANAIENLTIAIENTQNKRTKMRYRYVLAQLYMEQKEYALASDMFQKVIRMNPPYEMTFNATISRATASKSGGTADVRDVKKQLNKMLRDSKNNEYHDQIYYALAEIELHEGNTEQAIEFFQKSAQAATVNLPQKTKSYLTLANLFYDRRDYIPAQAYYDSAMINMEPTYTGYGQISVRAKNLKSLVQNLNTIHFQDSVQRLARMSEAERNRLISGIIAELRLKEQREKEAEAQRMQQYQQNMSRRSTLQDPTARSTWYFYNPAAVTQGASEFEARWGRRNLEDNWRRKYKGTAEMAMAADADAEDEVDPNRIQDVHTPGYYLQDIPLTDSMMLISHRMIEESLYAAGYIYNTDFAEYAMAAEQYESLIRRYPQSDYLTASYYYLYQLYKKINKHADSERNKNMLLSIAPESVYAKIILDPSYLDRLAQLMGESEQLYQQTYEKYTNEEFFAVITLSNEAFEKFPNDALLPRFAYLRAIATGRMAGTNEAMRNEMRQITADYPRTEIATAAQNLIDIIDDETPEMRQAEQVERAKTLYVAKNETDTHFFVWMLNSRESINQLWFDLQNFSIEHFINDRLTIERSNFNATNDLLIVKGFTNFQNITLYLTTFAGDRDVKKNINYEYSFFLISEENLSILQKDGNIADYIEFFKTEYR